ncbi:MAG: hypothetical protein NTU95_10100, partial [Methanothrix sp.]|nr:hypothetical protein [Methanothrix sp.]
LSLTHAESKGLAISSIFWILYLGATRCQGCPNALCGASPPQPIEHVRSIYSGITDAQSRLQQMAAPGGADLFLSEPGEYIIFYENNSFMNGKFYSTSEQIPGLEIRVREKATGSDLATYPTKSSITYSLGSRSGRSIMAFTALRAGIYQVNASYSGRDGTEVVLAIGKGMVEGIFSSIIISMAALFGSIAIAAVIAFVTYRRRKKAFLKLEEEERLMRGGF